MSAHLTTYEVTVEIVLGEHYGYSPIYKKSKAATGVMIKDTVRKMFHIESRTPRQAVNRCKKYGNPISVRKINVRSMHKDFEQLPVLNGVYVEGNPYSNALSMDEMIWQKRNNRRSNLHKDKKRLANE